MRFMRKPNSSQISHQDPELNLETGWRPVDFGGKVPEPNPNPRLQPLGTFLMRWGGVFWGLLFFFFLVDFQLPQLFFFNYVSGNAM